MKVHWRIKMTLGGYAHRVGRVNLTAGQVKYEDIPEEWALKYVGGRGLGVKYCLEADPKVDPLSPGNILCFMNGPLTGTRANMSGRMAVVTKSPLTGGITDSHHGGWSAARLRWAGFDGLIFDGKAEKPVYAYVENGKVELRDASDLWGKGIHETIKILQERYGKKDLSVIAIGPGSEKLAKFGCWINEDDRASGRGGTGTVGGSKNLKAVVIKSERNYPDPADPDAWKTAHADALQTLIGEGSFTQPRKGGLSTLGTNVLMNITSAMGALPTKNSQTTSFGDRAEKISGEYVRDNILVNNPTCHACPVACKKEVEVEYEGQKLRMESVEYEPAWAFGAHCDNDNIASVAWMIDQCNDYGLDAIEMGNCLATYMEVCDRGWNGTESLNWGDHKAMVALVAKTGKREGVGDILAGGVLKIAEHFGHPEVAMQSRGQSIPAYDPRGMKGMGLGYATSNRGACHLRGYSPASELGVIGLKTDPLEWKGKGELLKLLQDLHAFSDSLDLCKFSAFSEDADNYAAQYAAIVGVEMTAEKLLEIGERVYNTERYYNQLAGEKPGSDTLPKRFTEEASTMPGSEGHVCELGKMLEEYYDLRGWENGVVPEAKLKALGIK
jgi:aldehyde:ferredoxin oxidoreductase